MMYGQMTAGSWIYIGTQVSSGTYENIYRHVELSIFNGGSEW